MIDFYRDNINDLDVPKRRIKENEEEDATLAEAGKREVWFMSKLWDNDPQGAWEALEPVTKDVAIFDPALAGWYLSGALAFQHAGVPIFRNGSGLSLGINRPAY